MIENSEKPENPKKEVLLILLGSDIFKKFCYLDVFIIISKLLNSYEYTSWKIPYGEELERILTPPMFFLGTSQDIVSFLVQEVIGMIVKPRKQFNPKMIDINFNLEFIVFP